jgi:hypothetical protein
MSDRKLREIKKKKDSAKAVHGSRHCHPLATTYSFFFSAFFSPHLLFFSIALSITDERGRN